MTQDYQAPKLPVFTGINDIPRLATSTLAENGSALTDRINTLFDSLDIDINDLDARLSGVEGGGSPTQNAIFNSTGLTDFDDWFPNGVNGIIYLTITYFPEILSFWSYDVSSGQYRPADLGIFNRSFNSNVFSSIASVDVLVIDEGDLPQTSFDLSALFTKGKGLYVFMFYDIDSSGYGGSSNLPSNSSIIFNTINPPKGIEIVDIYRDDRFNIGSGEIEQITDTTTDNNQYNVNTGGKIQALKVIDPNDYDITFTLSAT